MDVESDGASRMTCRIVAPSGEFPVEIPALGDHMIYPTLMAAAVGEHFGLTHQQIADGVLHFAPTKMRMNILHRGEGITILNDTYNANPQSMRAAVQVLSGAKGEYKVAVLGDMFELGPLAPALHAGIGDYLGKAGIDCLVAVGELAKHIYDAAQAAGVPCWTAWCAPAPRFWSRPPGAWPWSSWWTTCWGSPKRYKKCPPDHLIRRADGGGKPPPYSHLCWKNLCRARHP